MTKAQDVSVHFGLTERELTLGLKILSREEIKQRIHRFNLENNWDVFKDVPDCQAVSVMYPNVLRLPGWNDQQYRDHLIELFGPL